MNAIKKVAKNAAMAWTQAGNVASPCISVCRMDAALGLCTGCLRTLDEIGGWSGMDDAEKRTVWRQIEWRAAQRLKSGPAA
jgi:uncharacterized protein